MKPALSAGLALAIAAASGRAAADTQCGTVAEFNANMAANATHAEDVTLTFDVVGVNPSDFHNTKGSLAQMRNTECNGGAQDAVIKVYGTSEPLNTAHLPGTLKLEYGNQCCASGSCGEGWASPNPSEVIFADGSEQCKVSMWVKPAEIGYKLECGGTVYEAVGDNNDHQNRVNHIALLDYFVSDGGKTWELPNATASGDQVCWVVVPQSSQTLTVPVIEDVTAGPSHAGVFPDVGDLAVEAGDNEAYLKFDVPQVAGTITEATLFMHTRTESFAAGDGGEVYVVTSNAWSESTLTWSTRPPRTQSSLGRIGPAAADMWVSLDVTAAVSGPGTHSFAIVSPPTDGNGTHFFSKEGSASGAAYLRISYEPGAGGSAGAANGGSAGASGASGSGWGTGGSGWGSGAAAGAAGTNPAQADSDASTGCATRTGRPDATPIAFLALALALVRRRRPRRR